LDIRQSSTDQELSIRTCTWFWSEKAAHEEDSSGLVEWGGRTSAGTDQSTFDVAKYGRVPDVGNLEIAPAIARLAQRRMHFASHQLVLNLAKEAGRLTWWSISLTEAQRAPKWCSV
jgi:hypothetical protein